MLLPSKFAVFVEILYRSHLLEFYSLFISLDSFYIAPLSE